MSLLLNPIFQRCKGIFFASMLLMLGCDSAPNKVSESKMVRVMADAMTVEAGHQIRYNYGLLPDSVWQKDYQFICKKHGVSYADFVEELVWYQDQPEAYSKLLEQVITYLQQGDSRYGEAVKPTSDRAKAIDARIRNMLDTAVEKNKESSGVGGVILLKKDNNRKR